MALLPILEYPDKRLRQASTPVETVTDEIRKLASDMAETMYAAPGVGLAAIQVGMPIQLIVMDTAAKDEPSDLCTLLNPHLVEMDGGIEMEEGCLSLPGLYEDVIRPERVTVEYTDLEGRIQRMEASGLKARCAQHEMDHLKGIIFTDHLSILKRKFALRKVERFKSQREQDAERKTEA